MATLDKRVQVLFDPERYAILEAEARASGVSVGAFIREAVDLRISEEAERVRSSWQALWDRFDALPERYPATDWEEMKIEWELEMDPLERARRNGSEI